MIAGAPSDPAPEAGATGRFKFQLRPAEGGTQQIELIADHLPLAPIEPWLARKVRGARLAGFASTDLRANYAPGRDGRPQVAATGKIDAAQVHFTADALAGDLVDLPRATIALDAALANGRITARQFEANSDGIEAKLAGEFDLAELSALGPRKLPTRDANLTLQVNLSKLAAMLPRTLRLREGLRIDSGVMEISARSSEAGGKRLWTAAAAVEDLVGSNGRKAIRWTQPVEAGVNLTDSQQGPQLERLLFRTPFATADAHAEADGFSGDAKFNLGDVARELGQFVDLSAWKLRGAGEGQFRFRPDGDRFAATATMDLAEIDVRRDGKPVWVDEKLRVELDAAGQRRGLAPQRIETGKIFMRGPADTLTAELVEPFAVGLADQNLSLKVDGAGPLQSWAGRLRPWIAAIPPELTGQATLQARLRARAGFVEVAESQLAIEQFQMRSGSTEIAEPRIEAQGDLRFDAAGGTLESESLQFSSSTLAARARNLSLRFADNATPSARGEVAFRSDLGRLATWRLWNSAPGSLQPRGHGHSQKTNTGGQQSKHGIWHEQLDECIRRAAKYDLKISGLHMHIGSGTDLDHLSQVCGAMEKTALAVGPSLTSISAGGGMATPYRPGDKRVDLAAYYKLWDAARQRLAESFNHPLSLEIEPGRYLSAESGYLIAEIRAVKRMGENLFYVVDAGFNNLARPILYGAYHPMSIAYANKAATAGRSLQQVIVGGPLCESGDIFTQEDGGFVRSRELPVAEVGDYLVIRCAGAYGAVMGSNYNSKPLAPEVLIENGKANLIRARQSFEDLIRGEEIPNS
jgi:hypothetical protein